MALGIEEAQPVRLTIDHPKPVKVNILLRRGPHPAEKYLKAVLAERVIPFPKVHDLTRLLDLIDPANNELTAMRADLNAVSRLSTQVRYPGFSADSDNAKGAGRIAAAVRRICRRGLGLQQV